MRKCINYIIKADKTKSRASLLKLFSQLIEFGVVCNAIRGIFNCIKLAGNTYVTNSNGFGFECSWVLRSIEGVRSAASYLARRADKISQFKPINMTLKVQKIITGGCKINDQFKPLTKIVGGHSVCQENTALNRQHSIEAINSLLKLYGSTLVKYRYTSLELAVRFAALIAYPLVNFHADNLVKVGSSDRNYEQCL